MPLEKHRLHELQIFAGFYHALLQHRQYCAEGIAHASVLYDTQSA
jgi:hypothetical protein